MTNQDNIKKVDDLQLGPAVVAMIEKQVHTLLDPIVVKLQRADALLTSLDTVVDLLNADGHAWSSRPCQTCSAVTALAGRSFGCVAHAEKVAKVKAHP